MVDYSEGAGYQYHSHLNEELVGAYVIVTGDSARCKTIAECFDDAKQVADNREYLTYTGTLEGEKISVISTGMGGPAMAILLEEIFRCGVHTVIRIGTCGGMQLEVKGGDLVVATGAVRMEGTTKQYAPIEFPAVADLRVSTFLCEAAHKVTAESDIDFHYGPIQSKDSFFGQVDPDSSPVSYDLKNKWEAWIRCGALASEMECSTLFVVSSIHRVRAGAVLLALANQEREKNGLPNPQNHDILPAIKTAVEAMRHLIAFDRMAGQMGEGTEGHNGPVAIN